MAADPGAYALAVAAQAIPVVAQDKVSHYAFFLGLSTLTVYLASRAPSLAPPEEKITFKQALIAPVAASVSLGGLYAVITILKVDPSFGYRLLTSLFASGASFLLLNDALGAVAGGGGGTDDDGGETATTAVAAALALSLAGVYLGGGALGLDDVVIKVAAANFLAWSLALFAARTVPVRSFKVGAALLFGLFCYDVFFVFGSDIMVTVATKIDAPVKLVAPNPAGSANAYALLGLGDVALPSLMVAFLARRGDALGEAKWRRNAVLAYAVGLCCAFYANECVRAGQPALLYLVPLTVGSGVLSAGGPDGLRALLDYEEASPGKRPSG